MGPPEVPARAPTCLQLNSDALARRPQPVKSSRTFFFSLFAHVFGTVGAVGQEESEGSSPLFDVKMEGTQLQCIFHCATPL